MSEQEKARLHLLLISKYYAVWIVPLKPSG